MLVRSFAFMKHPRLLGPTTLLLAGLALACGDHPSAPNPSLLNGSWARLNQVPGSSERWNLDVHGSSVTGNGTWSGEACCSGTATIVGTIDNGTIHLDVTLVVVVGGVPNIHEHFDGALASPSLLVGTSIYGNAPPAGVRLQKQ